MTDSIAKCDLIIKNLKGLQLSTKTAKDQLDTTLLELQKTLEKNSQTLGAKMKNIEAKMKAAGCVNNGKELLRVIFTLGISCLFDSNTKKELQNIKTDL